ncbi:MAG: indolepyruvate ferredoxin oxidoreductase subunit alpha [Bacillota bacterium]
MKTLMSGNEAIARGAWEAGVRFASAYPGTPSTEILENMAKYQEVRSQWSVNEKTALEAALGASLGGVRALCAMKHVGLNVAADPLFSSSYTGVNAGLVIVTADDPGCHSSQNEQDNRYYAQAAKLPLLEPSDSQEALDFARTAFELSEEYDTPVLLRVTTRVAHGKSPVATGPRTEATAPAYERTMAKHVLVPAVARPRHAAVEERLVQLQAYAESSPMNRIEWGSRRLGVVSSGVAYQYAREVLGDNASYLKLGMSFPFPDALARSFISQVEQVIVVEELEPFLEQAVRALGIDVKHPIEGKSLIPLTGELDSRTVALSLAPALAAAEGRPLGTASAPPDSGALGTVGELGNLSAPGREAEQVVGRPPMFCAGCPHRGVFYELGRLPVMVSGDIGCYALGAMPPFAAMDTCIDMGASIAAGLGFQTALDILRPGKPARTIAVIGDSTFFHSGMTGLLDAAYNSVGVITIILDNRITAMTGHQENPGSGFALSGAPAREAQLAALVRAIGIEMVQTVDPFDLAQVREAIAVAMGDPGPSVIIAHGPCALLRRLAVKRLAYQVDQDTCRKCKACLRVACPALCVEGDNVQIDAETCVGCGICSQVCRFDSIRQAKAAEGGEE